MFFFLASISRPLEKVDKMVVINSGGSDGGGVSKITGDVAQVIAQLPPVVEALSGVDLAELIQKIPQLKALKEKKKNPPSQDKGESPA